MFLIKLAISNFRVHKVRIALTVSAIALSVSLVVSVTSSYASLSAAAQRMLGQMLGTTDVQITRNSDSRAGISENILDRLRQDPDVIEATGRFEFDGHILTASGTEVPGRVQFIGIERPDDERVNSLGMEQGKWFNQSDTHEAVIDQVAIERLGAKLGDEFIIPAVDRQLKLKIVGVVHKPGILAGLVQTVYVPLRTLQSFMLPDNPRQLTRIMLDLRVDADQSEFVARWQKSLQSLDSGAKISRVDQNRSQMDENLQGLGALSYLGGTVSMMAAAFIIFSALSMGVSERQRTLAMLRAIGALRWQIGTLVVVEGLALAVCGVLVGVPLGMLWMKILAWKYSFLFTAGAVYSGSGISFAAAGACATAVLASFLPAFSAMRISPLEAMTPLARPTRTASLLWCAIAGPLLMAIDPLVLNLPIRPDVQFYIHFILGLPAIMIGFFLISPLLILAVEAAIGPLVAALVGLRYVMLRQQLSGGVWRTAGSCAALMVSLAILVVTQTQGTSAIQGWKLPEHFPDLFIFSSLGLSPADQEKLQHVKGIRPDQFMPIAIASPELGSSIFAIAGAVVMPNATMFLGVDPDLALQMMELDFRDGNPQDAARMLKMGDHIIVTQEFKELKGLRVGDKLAIKTNRGVVDFTVAGVVWSPGIDVITSMQDLNTQFEHRTATSVFGSYADAKKYFGIDRAHLFAANLEPDVEKKQLIASIKATVGNWGLEAGDVRQMKYTIQKLLSRLLLLASTVAYASMAVAALGVTNTIMASIRSRRWHFGILRSIGVTRSQLLRIVLAEAILLGILGILLGAGAGAELVFDAHRAWGRFFGYSPPMVVPWGSLVIGAAAVMVISIVASLWPSIHVAQSDPLELLQAGRAAG